MAYQSLYRRYRPQKFSDIRGQEHVVKALRNAVRDDRVGHAYLLSGPRGTGKTTAARILAKVLNCQNPADGEPCGVCDSCVSIEGGTSFDLHELDAASNNKVDDIRDLLSKVALGTPGRTKVYLLDEVHMLTAGAENALLKTLEEPPDHVVFVLATTEPHKVVPTIRSRTQQLELTLIAADQMAELVREIGTDAGLDINDEIVGHVVKVGGGSARDTLSALDQVVAAGGVGDIDSSTADLLESIAASDPAMAIAAIEAAGERGADPRRIGERFIDALRTVFLLKMGSPPSRLSEPEIELAKRFVDRLTPAAITRSLETVGRALVDMRQAPDPRIDLEVAFVRLTNPAVDSSHAALVARIEALEAGAPSPAPAAAVAATPTPVAPPAAEATAAPPPATPAPVESSDSSSPPLPTGGRPA
ncbi:MAG: DNA polymerase III subunit gamma/tau, partial [Acidimicrobiales bacterium]